MRGTGNDSPCVLSILPKAKLGGAGEQEMIQPISAKTRQLYCPLSRLFMPKCSKLRTAISLRENLIGESNVHTSSIPEEYYHYPTGRHVSKLGMSQKQSLTDGA